MAKLPKLTPDEYFANVSPADAALAKRLRSFVLKAAPELVEEMKYGIPFYLFQGWVCYVNVGKSGVTLGFPNGIQMSDVHELFSGQLLKQMRHIAIPNAAFLAEHSEAIQEYITEAMVLNDTKKI